MKKFAKITLGALVVVGATLAATGAADARVSIGIGLGGPGYYGYSAPSYYGYGAPAYSYSCDPYSRWYDSYRCGYAPGYSSYSGSAYYGPSFSFGGFGGGYRDRDDFRGDRDRGFRGGGDRDGGDRDRGERGGGERGGGRGHR
jgi:hypothetical protein